MKDAKRIIRLLDSNCYGEALRVASRHDNVSNEVKVASRLISNPDEYMDTSNSEHLVQRGVGKLKSMYHYEKK